MIKFKDFLLSAKGFILMLVIALIIFFAIFISATSSTNEKKSVTCQEVSTQLENLGYVPTDTTYGYTDQTSNLLGSIAVETDNIRFDFFEFDNNKSALALFNNSHESIYKKRTHPFSERDENYDNYAMYSMSTTDMYYITIWVENTEIDAYCDYEYRQDLFDIIASLGYGS